jgi:uncharacterized membrane protein
MADKPNQSGGLKSLLGELPVDRLKQEMQHGLTSLGEKAISTAGTKLTDYSGRLDEITENGGVVGKAAKKGAEELAEGGSPVKGALKGGLSGAKDKVKEKLGGGSKGEKGIKSTNIIESIDVGVPIDVAYNQWTLFQEFSGFMKKVENVEQEEDTKVTFKAQVFWSHRQWQATILEQVPNERIVWRSTGDKGRVDGAVTFHELGPNLTRILVVLEYYPQGFMERTGNLWRAQGRRARLELKHFRRHVMTQTILEPEEVEGWRGEIRDGEVVRTHEEVVEEEQRQAEEREGEEPEGEYEEGEAAEYDEEEPEEGEAEEYDEGEEEPEAEYEEEAAPEEEYEEEAAEEEPEAEYEEEAAEEEPEAEYEEEAAEEEPEAEYEEEAAPEEEYEEAEEEPEAEYEEEERPRRRRRARAS